MPILLDDKVHRFSATDLPMLIDYKEGAGGSMFSVWVAAEYLRSGENVIFHSAFPMAKDELQKQFGSIPYAASLDDIEKNHSVILKSSKGEMISRVISEVKMDDYIFVVKNYELLPQELVELLVTLPRIILSGDSTRLKKVLPFKNFQSIIAFSKNSLLPFEIPEMEKYSGYLHSRDKSGILKLVV